MSNDETSTGQRKISPLADHEIGMTWQRTREYMRADFARLLENFGDENPTLVQRVFYHLLPNVQLVIWYRISRFLYLKGWRNTARLISLVTQYATGAEVPPQVSIGPGFFVGHSTLVCVYGRFGKNFTIYGAAGTGGGYGGEDIGGGAGYPVFGDNVSMAHFSLVQGPIRIGDNVKFGPHAHVSRDVPSNSVVIGAASKIVKAPSEPAAGAEPKAADAARAAPPEEATQPVVVAHAAQPAHAPQPEPAMQSARSAQSAQSAASA